MKARKKAFRLESWTQIEEAGGTESFIERELNRRGVLLPSPRRNIIEMKRGTLQYE